MCQATMDVCASRQIGYSALKMLVHVSACRSQVADNAGIFAEGGLKPYLQYVRNDPRYRSAYLESTLEWRDDVKDGMEVSTYLGPASSDSSSTKAAADTAPGSAAV